MHLEDFPVTPAAPPPGGWIPIRSLSTRHRERVRAHLRALETSDRMLRFGRAVSDELIDAYVDQLDFERDEVFGIFNRRLDVLGMAHLAYPPASGGAPPLAEFGVSVAAGARGRGYGRRLFDHAALHARNRGVRSLLIHALSENRPMLHIAQAAGARIERHGSEAEALLHLPESDLSSTVEQLVEDGAALIDYSIKRKLRRDPPAQGG
jgi:GNAT superfamily N-acetyltransferase